MPRFIFLIKATSEAEAPPSTNDQSLIEEMTTFNESINAAGILLGGDGFLPTSTDSFRVRYSDSEPTFTAGPFDVTTEDHVCGYWIVKTKDAEEALGWAKKIPFKDGEVVVRRIAEVEDMGDAMSSDVREREEKMRKDVEARLQG